MAKKTAVHHHRTRPRKSHSRRRIKWLRIHQQLSIRALEALLLLALLSVVLQVLYPPNWTLPFVRLGDIAAGMQSADNLRRILDWHGTNSKVTLKTPNKSWQQKWQTIGIGIDRRSTIELTTSYPLWERLIPFSSIVRMTQGNLPLITLVDQERLDAFAQKIVTDYKATATQANVVVRDEYARIDTGKSGYKYSVNEVQRQIRSASIGLDATIELIPQEIPPNQADKTRLQTLVTEANRILANAPLEITVEGESYNVNRAQLGQWLHFPNGTTQVQFDREVIAEFLQPINEKVAEQPGTITVHRLDGHEISRTEAKSGREIDVSQATNTIIEHLRQGSEDVVALSLVPVAPKITYDDDFSETTTGLQALIESWEQSTYGDYGIIVRELGGEGRYAAWQPDVQFVTASTFKIFVYYAVAKNIETGEVHYSDITDMGWTVEACLEEMIVHSTNPCAISLTNLVGWQASQRMIEEAGFRDTWIDNSGGGEKHSTVHDETNFMQRLHNGTLMADEPTERLLGYLKRQIWRGGVPSGVPYGVTVANKVGFYNGWVHDVAIVYSPSTTYILGIMSRGGSDPVFADLSQRVYDFFN